MKVSVAALVVLASAAFCSLVSSAPHIPTSCCFSFTARQIPRSMVGNYYETSSKCSIPAIVFITKKGRAICANPTDSWVAGYINNLSWNRVEQGTE